MSDEATKPEEKAQDKKEEQKDVSSAELDKMFAEVEGMFSKDNPFQAEAKVEGDSEEEEEASEGEETDDSGEEESEEEAEDASEEADEIASLKSEIAELKALIKEGALAKPEEQKEETPKEPKKYLTLSDDQFEEALSDKEKFEAIFNNSHELMKAELLKLIPNLVTDLVTTTTTTQNTVNKFREENKDIFEEGVSSDDQREVRLSFIRTVANQIESANPKLSSEQVLKKTAQTVREALGLKKDTKNAEKEKKEAEKEDKKDKQKNAKNAPFLKNVNSTSTNKDGNDLSEIQKEMAAMLRV